MSDLEQALNGEVPSEEPAEQQIEQPIEAETVQADADDSEQVTEPTGEEVTSPPEVKAESDPIEGLKAGISAERQRRQEAEQERQAAVQRAQQLEAYIKSNQQKPDFWENPEGTLSNYAASMQEQMRQMQTNLSAEMMRTVHQDYDQKESKFIEMAQKNPALIHEMNQSGNPAKFAYDYVSERERIAEMQDPNYREKLKAELRSEIEAELKQKVENDIQTRSSLPGTLSNERSAGGNTQGAYKAPDLESIIGV